MYSLFSLSEDAFTLCLVFFTDSGRCFLRPKLSILYSTCIMMYPIMITYLYICICIYIYICYLFIYNYIYISIYLFLYIYIYIIFIFIYPYWGMVINPKEGMRDLFIKRSLNPHWQGMTMVKISVAWERTLPGSNASPLFHSRDSNNSPKGGWILFNYMIYMALDIH